MRRVNHLPVLLLLGVGAIGGAACTAESSAEDAGSVGTTLTDTSVSVSTSSAPAGTITFDARNDGTTTHELYVFRTDLAADALPIEDDKVSEDADGVEFIAEVEDIAPGTAKPLTVDLPAGTYVVLCNIPGHFAAGMRTGFEVT
jgi:uncharacterized cupredoxin-like copper-binding protein